VANQLERRKAKRHALSVDVKFLIGGKTEAVGKLLDISENGLALVADVAADEGEEIVAYPAGLGRVYGRVARRFGGGIGVSFELSDHQKKVIRERIDAVLSGATYLKLVDRRGALRIRYNLETTARIHGNGPMPCVIIDMSRSGCRLKCDERPKIGTAIVIGALYGVVARYLEDGIGVKFIDARSRCRDVDVA
jgi:hypothetical protein